MVEAYTNEMIRPGRVTLLSILIISLYASVLHAQDIPPQPQAQQPVEPATIVKAIPDLPNTCRGAEEVNSFLQEIVTCLNGNEYVKMKVGEIGLSQRGVPILMVTVTAAGQSPGEGGLMIVARQHGNEPAGTRAALELVRLFALDAQNMSGLLGSMAIRIIPVANPDGMNMFKRRTANGSDMNRDWNSRRLPETRAVTQVIKSAQPQVLMDLHELTSGDSDRAFVLGIPSSRSDQILSAVKSSFMEYGMPVSIRSSERYSTTGLLHRHFAGNYGGVGFLVESKYTGDPAENLKARSEYHLRAVMGVIKATGR